MIPFTNNIKRIVGILLVICCCGYSYPQSIQSIWNEFIDKKMTLKKFGRYENGKEASSVVPNPSKEYLMLRRSGTLYWMEAQDGNHTCQTKLQDDYLFFRHSNNDWSWLRFVEKSGNQIFTISKEGIYRYFELTQWTSNLPQSAINDSPVFCDGNVNDLLCYIEDNTYSPATPMGKHFVNCPVANNGQKQWLENPASEPKGVNGFTNWSAKEIQLFPYGKPYPTDVNQTLVGDCNTASILAEMAYLYPGFIKAIIHEESKTSYAIRMFDPKGKRIIVRVSNKVLCDNKGQVVQLMGKGRVLTWSMILEKAIMKWLQVYKPSITIWGFGAEHATPLFTGDGRSFAISPGKLNKEDLSRLVVTCLQNGLIVNGGFNKSGMKVDNHESVAFHGHSFMLPPSNDYIFCMRNPWGHGADDNVMRIGKNASYLNTIDIRIISPGAAAPFFVRNLAPYVIPNHNYIKAKSVQL